MMTAARLEEIKRIRNGASFVEMVAFDDLLSAIDAHREAVQHHPRAADGSVITLGSKWRTRSLYADALPGETIEVVVTSISHDIVRAASLGRQDDLPYLPEHLHPILAAAIKSAQENQQ